ncbi:MAG: phage tail protein [Imperialibacter sp.]|uniref:phage tail protein n=1 Tax=Imperialibacter sp. TaxID=2038411 RepID=UPI0032F0883E
MKPFVIALLCCLLYQFANAQNNGIAVQGIARNSGKTALVSKNLTFTFTLKNPGGTTIYNETATIMTDAFGVFSHIIGTGNATTDPFDEIMFHHEKLSLVISVEIDGVTTEISNSPFQYSPYAKAADNGVPTGSILPFIGTTAPAGWVLCNGQSLTSVAGAAPLIALLGNNNAPDLRGMFLRGTGNSPVNGQSGPSLKGTQADGFENHLHGVGTLDVPNNSGDHTHSTNFGQDYAYSDGDDGTDLRYGSGYSDGSTNKTTNAGGGHDHSITGSTALTGGLAETRPVSYGINYIIKL